MKFITKHVVLTKSQNDQTGQLKLIKLVFGQLGSILNTLMITVPIKI